MPGAQTLLRATKASRGLSYSRWLVSCVVSLVVPGECRLCDAALTQAAAYPVCDSCLRGLPCGQQGTLCSVCGEALPMESEDPAGQLCHACVQQRPAFVQAVAAADYDDLRAAIHLMKFEGVPALAEPLASLLANMIQTLQSQVPDGFLVVPVPLFRGKRPFNQSYLVAQAACSQLAQDMPLWPLWLDQRVLTRSRRTQSQFLLTPAQRRDNVRGAFTVTGNVDGQDVLLVDDIYTTGATAHECTRVLLRAGARSVCVATLARAQREVAVRWQPPARDDPGDQ